MATSALPSHRLRFDDFEVDLRSGELWKSGKRVRLQDQPFQVLCALLQRQGEIVTREELKQTLWPADTFVDFDDGLNTAVRKIRDVLGDSAEKPRYVETIPRRGYRFVGQLADVRPVVLPSPAEESKAGPEKENARLRPSAHADLQTQKALSSVRWRVLLAGVAVLAVFSVALLLYRRSSAEGTKPSVVRSIAVLPLENLSNDPEQEYFADGMSEELTTQLAQASAVRVISRTSVLRFKGTKTPVSQIARELHVDAIVEGSVARYGQRVRINAQLIDASSDRHLWAHSYERDLREILALQAEVAGAIATEVNGKLTPQQRTRIASARPTNPDAYVAYLKGRYFIDNRRSQEGAKKSLEYSLQAVNIDPDWALAHSGLANSYVSAALLEAIPPKEALPQAKLAAERALQLDPDIAEAHVALANVLMMYDFNQSAADPEFRRAIELSPGGSEPHRAYANYLANVGRSNEAISEVKLAHQLDPLSFWVSRDVGRILYECRHYDEALEALREASEMNPHSPVVYNWLSWAYDKKGMIPESVEMDLKDEVVSGTSDEIISSLRKTFQTGGQQAYLKKKLEISADNPYLRAQINARLGNRDEAFRWLEKMYEERSGWVVKLEVDPELDNLHADPRFEDLARRLGLPQ